MDLATLLPTMTCGGLTHNEARREAGLTGIETYVAQIVHLLIPEQDESLVLALGKQ